MHSVAKVVLITWADFAGISRFTSFTSKLSSQRGRWTQRTSAIFMNLYEQSIFSRVGRRDWSKVRGSSVRLPTFGWIGDAAQTPLIPQYRYGCGSKCKVWIKPRSHTRSRPPIQTSDPDLSKGFDPDLWNDIMYWWVDVWSSDGCMLLGFLLCSYSPCQAAKQQTVVKPRCQAVTLRSCTCRKVTLLSSPAAKLQLLHIQAAKLPSWHCWASLPSSQAAHLLPAHLVVLFLSCCIQAATYTSMWVHFWADPDPDPDRSRPDPDHNHNQLRPRPHPAPC